MAGLFLCTWDFLGDYLDYLGYLGYLGLLGFDRGSQS